MLSARRIVTRAAAAAVPFVVLVGAVLAVSDSAAADSAGPNQPGGGVEHVTSPASGVVEFTGWTADPDARTSNVLVAGVVDGRPVIRQRTSVERPMLTAKYHLGPTPGFVLDVPVPTGDHSACLVAYNIGAGLNRVMKCVYTPLGRVPSSAEIASHSPRGAVTWTNAGGTWLHVVGWTSDPDYLARRLSVAVYVDGHWSKDTLTGPVAGRTTPSGAGPNGWFDVTVTVTTGAHLACVWVVNIGAGQQLGPRLSRRRHPRDRQRHRHAAGGQQRSSRRPRRTSASPTSGAPRARSRSTAPAWSCTATRKSGVATPRMPQDQFDAARLIRADRAVPGDLVFYHDSDGRGVPRRDLPLAGPDRRRDRRGRGRRPPAHLGPEHRDVRIVHAQLTGPAAAHFGWTCRDVVSDDERHRTAGGAAGVISGPQDRGRPDHIPLFTGVIGYITNWTGVLMLFKPIRFYGFKVPGLKVLFPLLPRRVAVLPLISYDGRLGWQGIVPSRADKMASIAVDKGLLQARQHLGLLPRARAGQDRRASRDRRAERDPRRRRADHAAGESAALARPSAADQGSRARARAAAATRASSAASPTRSATNVDQLIDAKLMVIRYFVRIPSCSTSCS